MTGRDFWQSSGYFMLERDASGRLRVTDHFLRAYFARPELHPVAESCAAEVGLHDRLTRDPKASVPADDVAAIADADARGNYEIVLRFRDSLLAHETLETCYLALFRDGVSLPPLFLDHLAHAILRGMLDGCGDALRLRAAELLFRTQKLTNLDGALLLADEEVVDQYAQVGGLSPIAQLMAQPGTPMRSVELDVLSRENEGIYWDRSDRFDTVLDVTFTRPGLDAFCRVVEGWVAHFLGVGVSVQPVQSIRDEHWAWHLGLDPESSAILNDLYEGREVGEERIERLLSLFRLEFEDPGAMLDRVAGRPVYMGLAVNADGILRMKPQNLLLNLPLARPV